MIVGPALTGAPLQFGTANQIVVNAAAISDSLGLGAADAINTHSSHLLTVQTPDSKSADQAASSKFEKIHRAGEHRAP